MRDILNAVRSGNSLNVKEDCYNDRKVRFRGKDREVYWFIEDSNSFDVLSIYDDMSETKGQFTQLEYMKEYKRVAYEQYLKMAKLKDEYFLSKRGKFIAELTLMLRGARTYYSRVVEGTTENVFKELYPNLKPIKKSKFSSYIDKAGGVDIILRDENTGIYFYIHITKNTEESKKLLKKKLDKKVMGYQRNPDKHIFMYYDEGDGENSYMLNGVPVFREEYIHKKVKEGLELGATDEHLKNMIKSYNLRVKYNFSV